MSLNAGTLANLIKSKVDAVADGYKDGTKDNTDALKAIAEALVEHITSDAEVKVTKGDSAGTYKVS